jgi:hypothetical protein
MGETRQPGSKGVLTMPIENSTVVLNGGAESQYRLYYGHEMGPDAGAFDYLHRVRTRAIAKSANGHIPEEAYWRNLNNLRTQFADLLPNPLAFELIVDPPSNSGYHRTFLSACHSRIGLAKRMIRFVKDTHVSSSPENINALREHCHIVQPLGEPAPNLAGFHNVLVVDDVYSTGTILTVVIEKLRAAGLPADAAITLACPLRIHPPEPPIDFNDLPPLDDGEEEPAVEAEDGPAGE